MEKITTQVALLHEQINGDGGLRSRVADLEAAEKARAEVEVRNFKIGIAILSAVSGSAGFLGSLFKDLIK